MQVYWVITDNNITCLIIISSVIYATFITVVESNSYYIIYIIYIIIVLKDYLYFVKQIQIFCFSWTCLAILFHGNPSLYPYIFTL